MPRMTRVQYDAGLDRICDQYDDLGLPMGSPAQGRVLTKMNAALETFKRTAEIVETTSRPAARPAARAVAETAPARQRPSRKAERRAARVAQAVRESLAATAAPKTAAPARAAAAPPPRLTDLSSDDLDAAAFRSVTGTRSPFWADESTPAAPVTESQTEPPARPLHEMSPDELGAHTAAVFGTYGRQQGYESPIWAA
jgi:hypothetical protein